MVALNHRVQFFRASDVVTPSGQRSRALVPVNVGTHDNKVWCDVRYPSGMEHLRVGASVVKCSILIRYRAGLNAGMSAEIDGRMHEIEAVLPDRKGGYVTLTAKVTNQQS